MDAQDVVEVDAYVEAPRICEKGGGGLVFPLGGETERLWDPRLKGLLYGTGLLYSFIGVSIVADIFMAAIERVTSKKKRVPLEEDETRLVTKNVWNETVANLTLMALGSSAPEILLAINDVLKNHFFAGALGPSTIVGSAAFNLFMIIAVCINAIPSGETREIKEVQVFHITAVWSVFAYLWLLFIVRATSPDVIEVWEGAATVVFFPMLVLHSYASDVGMLTKENFWILVRMVYCKGQAPAEEEEAEPQGEVSIAMYAFGILKWVCRLSMFGIKLFFRVLCKILKFCMPKRSWFRRKIPEEGEHVTEGEDEVREIIEAEDVFAKVDTEAPIIGEDGEPLEVEEGIFTFPVEVMEIWVGFEEKTVSIPVLRKTGTEGRVSVKYRIEGLSAVPDYDYEDDEGQIDLKSGIKRAEIEITILPKRRGEKDDQFQLILEEPDGGAILDPSTDGGDDACLLTITLRNENPPTTFRSRFYAKMDGWFNVDELYAGVGVWGEQILEALFVNGSREEQSEASWTDWVMHFMFFPWKMLYALLTPPPTFLGGWFCFVVALMHIGCLTAVIGDIAELFGCAANIDDSITAITFVALGTSLPDTFASKTAAQQDEWADASIVNVTGSNSVNVFLGIGLPWLLASLYWKINGKTVDWEAQYGEQYGDAYPSAAFVVNGAEDVAFSVMCFTVNALVCLVVIHLRRKLCGGELGGAADSKACSSFLLVLLWVSYIALQIWKADNPTADIVQQMIGLLVLIPVISTLMVIFLIMLQVLRFSKKYIGEEGFWGIFAAVVVLSLRAMVFIMFQAG